MIKNMRYGIVAVVKYHGATEHRSARYTCTGLGIRVTLNRDYSIDYSDMPRLVAQAWFDKAKLTNSYLVFLDGVMAYEGNGKYVIIFS